MINIQKSYSVHIVLFSPIWSILSSLFHIGSLRSTLVLFGLHWSYSNHLFSPFNPLWSTLDLFGPYGLLWSYSAHSIDFGSIRSTVVLFSPSSHFGPIQSTLVLFGPIWSYSILFVPIQAIMSTLVLICPFILIQSTLILFGQLRSYTVHIGPLCPIRVHFGPIRSTLFPFSLILSIRSTSILLYTYIQGKDMFELRASILKPNLLIYIYIYIYIYHNI